MTFDIERLEGVIPPLVTPFDDEGQLHPKGISQLVNYVIEGGVQAIFMAGTTGEAALLTNDEIAALTETTVEAARGRVPVLVGIAGPSTQATLERAKAAINHGADVLVAHIPYYFPPTQNELIAYFKTLASFSKIPVLLYSIPQTVKVPLSNPTVLKLAAEEPNIVGIKDSSGNIEDFRRLVDKMQEVRPEFRMLLGSDTLLDAAILIGAHGTVPGTGNLFPEPLVKAFHAAKAGDWAEAARYNAEAVKLTRLYNIASESLFSSIVACLKYGLSLKGIEAGKPRPPLVPLTTEEEGRVRKFLAESE